VSRLLAQPAAEVSVLTRRRGEPAPQASCSAAFRGCRAPTWKVVWFQNGAAAEHVAGTCTKDICG